MTNLVAYKDELNTVPLRNFNSKEMDLFFSICSKMRNKGLTNIIFDFENLRELSDYKYTAHDRFVKDIEGVYDKLLKLDMRIGTATEFTKFVLFTKYTVSAEKETVEIKINEEFKDILNNISGNFTKFELIEFTSLNSSYSKTAYRLLKQFRSTGYYIVKIDEFKRLFDIPKSYQMSDIDKRVFAPIAKELPHYFENLVVTKLLGKGKRKRHIDYIEFKFKPQTDVKNGEKTFRNEDGEYYKKNILDFNDNEIEKTFLETKPVGDLVNLKNKMGLSKEKYKENQISKIYETAMQKILETQSNNDVFEYIKFYYNLAKRDNDVVDKFSYLVSALKNDCENNLDQQSFL